MDIWGFRAENTKTENQVLIMNGYLGNMISKSFRGAISVASDYKGFGNVMVLV